MRRYTTTDGQVISLMCARFEDALAEGRRDAVVTEHASECVRCHMLLADLDSELGVLRAIGTASGPVALPTGFTEGVLARSLPPERYLLEPTPAEPTFRLWHHALTGVVAGVVTALVFWAVALDQQAVVESDSGIATQVLTLPAGVQGAAPATIFGAGALRLLGSQEPVIGEQVPSKPARAWAPGAVPELTVDLGKELRAAIVRQVRELKGCPKRLTQPLRVSLAVATDGAISNRTVYSVAAQGGAHDCVNKALDAMILPPMSTAVNVTLDIVW
jgi:hypothetical protein